MKQLFFVLALLFSCFSVFSQEPTGAAKTQYKMFYKNIEKLKVLDYAEDRGAFNNQLSQAENAIKNVKKYDPTFDSSKMEEDINVFRLIKNGEGTSTTLNSESTKLNTSKTPSNSNVNWDKSQVVNSIKEMKIEGEKSRGTSITANEITKEAEEKLAVLKANHPDFDASAYEIEIAEYKLEYSDSKNATEENEVLSAEFKEQYKLLFESRDSFFKGILIGSEEDKSKILADLKKYQTEINAFVNSNAGKLGRNTSFDSPAGTKIHNLEQKGTYGLNLNIYAPTGKNEVLSDYYKLKFQEAWALGLQQLFGDAEPVLRELKKINASLDYLKSPENAEKIAAKNAADLIAKALLRPEGMHNAALLIDIKSAVMKSSFGKGKEIENLRIVSNGWNVYKHWLSGAILYRDIGVQMTTVENGKCILHTFAATEEFIGNAFVKCYVGYHNEREMLCENK